MAETKMPGLEAEIELISRIKEDYNSGDAPNDLILYTPICTVTGAVSGFAGGIVSAVMTGDPVYMAQGTFVSSSVGFLLGFLCARHVGKSEYKRLTKRQEKIQSEMKAIRDSSLDAQLKDY